MTLPTGPCHNRPLRCAAVLAALMTAAAPASGPIKLHPDNPHYFEFAGRPTVLLTSGEHYGAVLNTDFDYRKYLKTLQSHRFNQTRTFSGAYCENPGAFSIENNTLAPKAGKLLCPWARSDKGGYAGGGNKFDLTRWDGKYFDRLKGFVAEAGKCGVVVEFVLFCPFYGDEMWALSPMNAKNNVNGVGDVPRTEVYTLKHPKLLDVHKDMVRQVVRELNGFDNLYYEICNEPYFGGVTLEWQREIARVIAETEEKLPKKHLIAQNIANEAQKITDPDPRVSVFNFHYARPEAARENYGLGKALGDDETGFRGDGPTPYRVEAWGFLLSGGGEFSNLDYSFTAGSEDGAANPKAPGSRGPEVRKQLEVLRDFLTGFDFVKMSPAGDAVKGPPGQDGRVTALAERGRQYAVHVTGDGPVTLKLDLPAGKYRAEWVSTRTGERLGAESFAHRGGARELRSPGFREDIALAVRAGG